jgi:hypothetical protein
MLLKQEVKTKNGKRESGVRMGRLYAGGKSKPVMTVIAESWAENVIVRHGMEVDWLLNEHCETLVIEGRVDLSAAAEAMQRESSGHVFPALRHAWMRFTTAGCGLPNTCLRWVKRVIR